MEWYYWLVICLAGALVYFGFGKIVAEFLREKLSSKLLSRQSAWAFFLGWPLLLASAIICICLLLLLTGFVVAVAISLIAIVLGLFVFAIIVTVAFLILAFGLSLVFIIVWMVLSPLDGPAAIKNIITRLNPLSPRKSSKKSGKKR